MLRTCIGHGLHVYALRLCIDNCDKRRNHTGFWGGSRQSRAVRLTMPFALCNELSTMQDRRRCRA